MINYFRDCVVSTVMSNIKHANGVEYKIPTLWYDVSAFQTKFYDLVPVAILANRNCFRAVSFAVDSNKKLSTL